MKNILLVIVLLFSVTSCTPSGGIDWPKIATCAPTPSDLLDIVQTILVGGGGDTMKQLEDVARDRSATAVVCAADLVAKELRGGGKLGSSPESAAAMARTDEFLKKVGSRVNQPDDVPTAGGEQAGEQ